MQLKVYPGLILSFCLGLLLVGVGWFGFRPQAAPRNSQNTSVAVKVASQRLAANPNTRNIPHEGKVRVMNQTDVPVRLTLLAQALPLDTYSEPAHWDFAPGEGDGQGLTLALPEGALRLASGDILMAFAVDGSRLYWGPYVAGKTELPIWESRTLEWQLVLRED